MPDQGAAAPPPPRYAFGYLVHVPFHPSGRPLLDQHTGAPLSTMSAAEVASAVDTIVTNPEELAAANLASPATSAPKPARKGSRKAQRQQLQERLAAGNGSTAKTDAVIANLAGARKPRALAAAKASAAKGVADVLKPTPKGKPAAKPAAAPRQKGPAPAGTEMHLGKAKDGTLYLIKAKTGPKQEGSYTTVAQAQAAAKKAGWVIVSGLPKA